MKIKAGLITLFFILICCSPGLAASADAQQAFSALPTDYKGRVWRIGYYQGGDYIDYKNVLSATVRGLMDLGWIEKAEFPVPDDEQVRPLWDWLSTKATSEYIQFVGDAFDTTNWTNGLRKQITDRIINRLNVTKDIDLMFAMGTWAGQDLANNRHHTPTLILSSSNPLSSGIIKSVEDSGYDHVHARVAPYRYARQVRIFHEIIGFKRLGLVYENSNAGKTYGAIDEVEKVAEALGFELVRCFAQSDTPKKRIAETNVIACFKKLAGNVDAIYVSKHGGVQPRSIPDLVNIAIDARMPTFSQTGSEEVKNGFLLSIATAGFGPLGAFHAETLGKIFNGAKPRQLPQLFVSPAKIAINLETARRIGYDPSVDVLGAADEIYMKIEKPK